jgi:NAD(P)-dependent dehydrogenase (short-subunit alcohol dehydrogenase family)
MNWKLLIKKGVLKIFSKRPVQTSVNIVHLSPNELLKGRCALITGGTSGIGFSIAQAFLNAGADVIITGRNKDKLSSAVSELSKEGRKVKGYILDNTRVDTFENTFQNIIKDFNKIDILVNNAGILGAKMPNAEDNIYDLVIKTNLKGPFFLSQMIGKYMKENQIKGNILNIASSSSLRPAVSAYTLSKWGLRGLTLGLAKALSPYGITVNGVAPGPTATPMLKRSNENITNDKIPLKRYVMPEEIANMAVFLVSDMGRSIIGDIVYMTGGAGVVTYEDMDYNF